MSRDGIHQPVLLEEVVAWAPPQATYIMDGTMGHGGHTIALCRALQPTQLVGVDRDQQMIRKAQQRIAEEWYTELVTSVQGSYADMETNAAALWWPDKKFSLILLDIGVNMEHFKDAERWFSLKHDAPLDMRYDMTTWMTASEWLMSVTYDEVHHALAQRTDFGDRMRDSLVHWLLQERKRKPLTSTYDLVQRGAQNGLTPKRQAVLFQAVRIAVNQELQQLEEFLRICPAWVEKGWRVIVISYHSGEDRMVKQAFKDREQQGKGNILTKSVITPKRQEIKTNKAARSAKMRVFACADVS